MMNLDEVKGAAEGWLRNRFALPLLLLLAAALLLVSEQTYRETTSTLTSGIALTDARIRSQRLLQLLTESEAAEFGYLVSGQSAHLEQYAAVKAELAGVQGDVLAFLMAQGTDGEAAARRVAAFTRVKLEHIDNTLNLARQGRNEAATQLANEERNRATSGLLRAELLAQLARAAELQDQARTSIYKALKVNRVAVGLLTLSTLFSLFLFVRKINRQDRERASQQAALLLERQHLEVTVVRRTARLSELAQHLQSVREDERARLARELHDELGALLTACKLDIARARMKTHDPVAMLERLTQLNTHLNEGIALKRRIIEDLRPSALANLGLSAALQNLCDDMAARLQVPVQVLASEFQLTPEAELTVYRFVQEALTNIGKYARASSVKVSWRVSGHHATVEVVDDGIGFEPLRSQVGRHGLSGMQFRAESLGGAMTICSAPGQGTTMRIEFPQAPHQVL
jgi:signal transduction histidine kinase